MPRSFELFPFFLHTMLTQLTRLVRESDGRYATSEELQFMKDYLKTAEQRVQAYKTIRDNEAFLIDDLHEQVQQADGKALMGTISSAKYKERDYSYMLKRDQKNMLRVASAAMLFHDLDFLREGLLLWHRTIIKSFRVERPTQLACKFWPQVMNKYLSPDEYKLMSPFVGLIRAVLG
jgi:Phycobilisome protein